MAWAPYRVNEQSVLCLLTSQIVGECSSQVGYSKCLGCLINADVSYGGIIGQMDGGGSNTKHTKGKRDGFLILHVKTGRYSKVVGWGTCRAQGCSGSVAECVGFVSFIIAQIVLSITFIVFYLTLGWMRKLLLVHQCCKFESPAFFCLIQIPTNLGIIVVIVTGPCRNFDL